MKDDVLEYVAVQLLNGLILLVQCIYKTEKVHGTCQRNVLLDQNLHYFQAIKSIIKIIVIIMSKSPSWIILFYQNY